MNHPRLQELIDAWRDGVLSEEQSAELNTLLRESESAREIFRRESELHGLLHAAVTATVVEASAEKIVPFVSPTIPQRARWVSWRPLTAAAAGIVLGMFCTSVVYGIATQRAGVVKKTALEIFDPGLENSASITERGVPDAAGKWGADSATVVTEENGVQPMQGRKMLRLEPIPAEKNVKNLMSRAYQVLDLRSIPIPGIPDNAEVMVTASFHAANADVASRFLVRAFALDETPEQATRGFWPKTQEDGVVSAAQRFETPPGQRGWHTFSLKMPLPRGAQTLVFVLGATHTDDAAARTSTHYLDNVQVSVLTTQPPQP